MTPRGRLTAWDRSAARSQPVWPVDAHAVAAAAGLHVTTARSHLDALIEAGPLFERRVAISGNYAMSVVANVSQAATAQVMTASRSRRLTPSRACTDRPCTTVV